MITRLYDLVKLSTVGPTVTYCNLFAKISPRVRHTTPVTSLSFFFSHHRAHWIWMESVEFRLERSRDQAESTHSRRKDMTIGIFQPKTFKYTELLNVNTFEKREDRLHVIYWENSRRTNNEQEDDSNNWTTRCEETLKNRSQRRHLFSAPAQFNENWYIAECVGVQIRHIHTRTVISECIANTKNDCRKQVNSSPFVFGYEELSEKGTRHRQGFSNTSSFYVFSLTTLW